jgi:hypothetical protein
MKIQESFFELLYRQEELKLPSDLSVFEAL